MEDSRVIILIDADAFFAAIEQRDHPEYRGKPVIVGARPGTRGVVSTCSYEARKYGVRSAMPISQAYRLCPHGIYLPPNFKVYSEVSKAMFEICEKYTPIVEPVSIDEGYLDVTPSDGVSIARKIREEIRETLGITVTAGVSYCRYLAKMAAEENKPDGLGVVTRENALDFLNDLPVGKLPGVGPRTVETLLQHGVRTCGDLRTMPPAWFEKTFGKFGTRLYELAFGIDDTPVGVWRAAKSVSEETTFEEDQTDKEFLIAVLARLSQDVGFRLRESRYSARTVSIKVRYSNFDTITRAKSLPAPVSSDPDIFQAAKDLFEKLQSGRPVRLLGVGASNLSDQGVAQPMLLGGKSWDKVSQAVDALRKKYGKKVINLGAAIRK